MTDNANEGKESYKEIWIPGFTSEKNPPAPNSFSGLHIKDSELIISKVT